MYTILLRDRASLEVANSFKRPHVQSSDSVESSESGEMNNQTDTEMEMSTATDSNYRAAIKRTSCEINSQQHHYGSFYLRMGAVGE
ncbi:unnamed protein product [Timema podura]|uniref:Uncharacterized protein n=1 Tax=Timema podura TaxID=61482 RepID=A0ABN7PPG8_TIMPD|nr:unnamed protein product [Timema podura]